MIDWKSYEVEFEDGHKASVEDTFPKYAAEQACADHHRAAGYPNEFNNVKVYCLDDGYKGTFDVSVNREPQFSAEEV